MACWCMRPKGRIRMLRIRGMVCALVLLTATAVAQNTDASDKETIRLLVQQVKELQDKVHALETKQNAAGVEQASSMASSSQTDEAALKSQPSFLQEMHEVRGIQW